MNAECQGLNIWQLPNPSLFEKVISTALIFMSKSACCHLWLPEAGVDKLQNFELPKFHISGG